MNPYAPPVDRLLSIGRPEIRDTWATESPPEGLSAIDVLELTRMATDAELLDLAEDVPHAYGPVHAWRALGHLRAADAIEPLLGLLPRIDARDDDWVQGDLPIVFGLIGQPAIAPLRAYLAERSHHMWARQTAADGLGQIGNRHEGFRDECAAAIAAELSKFGQNSPDLNAGLVSVLMDLRAVQHIGVIDRAYLAGRVESEFCGTLDDVRAEMGLRAPLRDVGRGALDDAIDGVLGPPIDETPPEWMKPFLRS
jgi:hypothetical protein